MTKIAVIGATGVLGRALIPMLVKSGHQVRALVRSVEKAKKLFPQDIEIAECDLLAPNIEQNISALLRDCETVAHIATSIPQDAAGPDAWEANTRLRTDAVQLLLKASLEAGAKRYIQQSITMAYPDCGDDWITEDMPLDVSPERAQPCDPVIKMEGMIQNIPPRTLQWCILRGGSFVGTDTFQDGLIENLRAGKVTIPCDGRNFISLIHVADMATAVAAAIERAPAGSTFNIVDEPLRQYEYSDRLAASIGAEKPKRDENSTCPPSWRCSNQRAKSALNWSPVHNIIPG